MHTAYLEQCLLSDEAFIAVGDLQNGYGVLPKLAACHERKIFIGDYLDSYIANPAQQMSALETIVGMAERGEALLLLGNHEASYLGPMGLRATGFNSITAALLIPVQRRLERVLRPFAYHEASRTLFTHAGVTREMWESYRLTFENLATKLHEWSLDFSSPYFFIGNTRGGFDPLGGPLWCDWHDEFEPVPGLTQVIGHTSSFHKNAWRDGDRIGNLRLRENNWNIDCLGRGKTFDMLVFEAGSFTGLSL